MTSKAFVRNLMEYCSPLWAGALASHLSRLHAVETKAFRIIGISRGETKACISLGCDSSRQNANGILQNVSKRSRWFSISSRESQDVALVSLEFWTCSKNSCDKFSLKIVTESSRLSQTGLEPFSISFLWVRRCDKCETTLWGIGDLWN